MISDLELFQILFDYSTHHRHLPSLVELEIKTGKSKSDLVQSLEALEKVIMFCGKIKHLQKI
ncbi:hypothetical protein EG487_14640 [Paenibacillus polymyxa]|nr:hypothetical protein EG487_14640 [Paenibacillus polymyxa]